MNSFPSIIREFFNLGFPAYILFGWFCLCVLRLVVSVAVTLLKAEFADVLEQRKTDQIAPPQISNHEQKNPSNPS